MKFPFRNLSCIEHWPHGPPHGSAWPFPQAGGRRALWDSILTLCRQPTSTLFLIPSPEQTPLSFACPSLVTYRRWFYFQKDRLFPASFPLQVNSTGTTLGKRLKLCHRIPTISPLGWLVSVAERLPACLSLSYSPALENQLSPGGNHLFVHKRSTWGWLTALCCYSWVTVIQGNLEQTELAAWDERAQAEIWNGRQHLQISGRQLCRGNGEGVRSSGAHSTTC